MNLQKIKETLKENLKALCSLNKNQFGDVVIDGIPCYPVMVELVGRTREALAELEAEKPEEDAIKELAETLEGWDRAGWSFSHIANDIVKYWGIKGAINFEEYHAKKCEECKQKKQSYKLFGVEDLPDAENRPEKNNV